MSLPVIGPKIATGVFITIHAGLFKFFMDEQEKDRIRLGVPKTKQKLIKIIDNKSKY